MSRDTEDAIVRLSNTILAGPQPFGIHPAVLDNVQFIGTTHEQKHRSNPIRDIKAGAQG